jgi:hypothetical protein
MKHTNTFNTAVLLSALLLCIYGCGKSSVSTPQPATPTTTTFYVSAAAYQNDGIWTNEVLQPCQAEGTGSTFVFTTDSGPFNLTNCKGALVFTNKCNAGLVFTFSFAIVNTTMTTTDSNGVQQENWTGTLSGTATAFTIAWGVSPNAATTTYTEEANVN